MTPNSSVQPYDKPRDTVSADELRWQELDTTTDDLLDDEYDGSDDVVLLDYVSAIEAEQMRSASAGPRRRYTADDVARR